MHFASVVVWLCCMHLARAFRLPSFCPRVIRKFSKMEKAAVFEVSKLQETNENTIGGDSLKECIQHRPDREVICGDSIEWLNGFEDDGLPAGYCGFTSLPDLSEVQAIFQFDTVSYKKWFTDTVALFMRKLSRGTYVVFLQSDIRFMSESGEVSEWIDKSFLCSTAAERTGCTLMWHKLVYTDKENNKRSTGRPSYSHLLCYAKPRLSTDPADFSHLRLLSKTQARKQRFRENRARGAMNRAAAAKAEAGAEGAKVGELEDLNSDGEESDSEAATLPTPPATSTTTSTTTTAAPPLPATVVVPSNYRTSLFAVPDIFFRGHMLWPKGIGLDSCFVGIMFLKDIANATGIIDPFAGQGTTLAMANAVFLPAIGVEISPKRCRKANNLTIDLDLVSPHMRKIALDIVSTREEAGKSDGTNGGGNVKSVKSENEEKLVEKLAGKAQVHVPRKGGTKGGTSDRVIVDSCAVVDVVADK